MVLLLVFYTRRRVPQYDMVPPDNDIVSGLKNDRFPGGGEQDNDTYDINPLRVPVLPPENGVLPVSAAPVAAPNGLFDALSLTLFLGFLFRFDAFCDLSDDLLNEQVAAANRDPNSAPYDELRVYDDEGEGLSPAPSLSSLDTVASSVAADPERLERQLDDWGPKFQNLADLYSSAGR